MKIVLDLTEAQAKSLGKWAHRALSFAVPGEYDRPSLGLMRKVVEVLDAVGIPFRGP